MEMGTYELRTRYGIVLNKLVELSAVNKQGIEFPIQLAIIPVKENENEFFLLIYPGYHGT